MGIVGRLKSEWAYLVGLRRALQQTSSVEKTPHVTMREMAEMVAAVHPQRIALVSPQESYTYAELDYRSNQYARWVLAQGLKKGDCVALFMVNRAEYVAAWLGIVKAGCVAALLNNSLNGRSLAHCVRIAAAQFLIADASLMAAVDSARDFFDVRLKVLTYGDKRRGHDPRLDLALAEISGEPLSSAERVPLTIADRAIFVYTSGTTGLPKAANISHSRLLRIMAGFAAAIDSKPDDRIYVTLPLYHATGGLCAVGSMLWVGGCSVIAEKFSARQFWSDIVTQKCTFFVYVGEMCRYLLAAPPSLNDAAHHLRGCFGNGLRGDIFEEFRDRFHLTVIREFYAATEGNISLLNFDSKPGAVGRIPAWARSRLRVRIIEFDIESEQPVRGADGLFRECANGETGEVIGEIVNDPKVPTGSFDGYADKAATEKKILRDVFKKGDAWFRSGDLMKRDALGYFYFIDRIGDTFRWKGQNVSTGEVSAVLTSFPSVEDANVYGVTIPHVDGRAGMAALSLSDPAKFNLANLRQHLVENLPDYARPLFLRIQDHMDLTGTFKQRKVDLVEQGFDPAKTSEPLWFNDSGRGEFVRIDGEVFDKLCNHGFRF